MDWNVIVTVKPGLAREHELLGALARFGPFRPTAFRDVCIGRVDDIGALLDGIRDAGTAGKAWFEHVACVVPAEMVLSFTPETLADRLKDAVTALVARMTDVSFYVRLERRGFAGKLASTNIERAVADRAYALAAAQGKQLRTTFADPDFIIAAATLGGECGLALLPRALARLRRPANHPVRFVRDERQLGHRSFRKPQPNRCIPIAFACRFALAFERARTSFRRSVEVSTSANAMFAPKSVTAELQRAPAMRVARRLGGQGGTAPPSDCQRMPSLALALDAGPNRTRVPKRAFRARGAARNRQCVTFVN